MRIMKVIPYHRHLHGAKIIFTDGKKITTYYNSLFDDEVYADVEAIDDTAYTYDFKEPLQFEAVPGYGFRFGNKDMMVSVPCYKVLERYIIDDELIVSLPDGLIVSYDKVDVLLAGTKDKIVVKKK